MSAERDQPLQEHLRKVHFVFRAAAAMHLTLLAFRPALPGSPDSADKPRPCLSTCSLSCAPVYTCHQREQRESSVNTPASRRC